MELSKYEKTKIEKAIFENLEKRNFSYREIKISNINEKLIIEFSGVSHKYFKNVRLITNSSYIKETVLSTTAFVHIRFLYAGYVSPKNGFRLTSIKIIL